MSPRLSIVIAALFGATLANPASAQKAEPEGNSVKQVETKTGPSLSRVRTSHGGLAAPAKVTSKLGAGKKFQTKRDERISPTNRAAAPKKKAKSPFAVALDTVIDAAKQARPGASGRLRVSFTVGRRGRVADAMVISFDPKLDGELEKVLRKHTFDRKLAGLVYTKTVAIKAEKKSRRANNARKKTAKR